jgi:ParB-like chromosome segregation protein Spo0J
MRSTNRDAIPSPTLVKCIEHRSVDQLIPYVRNARTHSEAQIAGSIKQCGFVNPVLIGPDGVIIAGHARVAAARQLGLKEVPVIVLDHLSRRSNVRWSWPTIDWL